jgi:hypothetical protein
MAGQRRAGGSRKKKRRNPSTSLKSLISIAKHAIGNETDLNAAVHRSLNAVRNAKSISGLPTVPSGRVIPIPKTGGVIPLVPIVAGLSALGVLGNTVSSVAKAVRDINVARRSFKGQQPSQGSGIVVTGTGAYLRPYRWGMGLSIASQRRKSKKTTRGRKKKV